MMLRNLSAVDIINKNIVDLKIEFVISEIHIENPPLPNIYCLPEMH